MKLLGSSFCSGLFSRNNVDQTTSTLDAELNRTCSESEQGIVAAATNVLTRVELGAALTHDDLAGLNLLTTEALDTETLGLGIATVAGAGSTLLSCHVVSLLQG